MHRFGISCNLVQVKAFDTVIPTSGATWPDRVAGLEGYDSWEQDYGCTFTSASLRETEIDLLVGTRGRRLSTRFSDNGRKRSTRRSSRAPMRGGRDASGTGPGRFVALDIGNAVDRRAAYLPCATALARAGSGPNRDVYRCHRGASCFPHTVGHVGGCQRDRRVGGRHDTVCDMDRTDPVSD